MYYLKYSGLQIREIIEKPYISLLTVLFAQLESRDFYLEIYDIGLEFETFM